MKKFVVKISIEGHMIQNWLAKTTHGWATTESLILAATFDSPADAHRAVGEWDGISQPWLLGYEVIFKGLCYPNPG